MWRIKRGELQCEILRKCGLDTWKRGLVVEGWITCSKMWINYGKVDWTDYGKGDLLFIMKRWINYGKLN